MDGLRAERARARAGAPKWDPQPGLTVRLRNAQLVHKRDGSVVVMNRDGDLVVMDDTGREREHHRLLYGATLKIEDGARVPAATIVAEWDPFASPILAEVGGIAQFGDLVEGVTVIEKVDEVTGLSRKIVIESRAADLRPRITIIEPTTGEPVKIPGTELDARFTRRSRTMPASM